MRIACRYLMVGSGKVGSCVPRPFQAISSGRRSVRTSWWVASQRSRPYSTSGRRTFLAGEAAGGIVLERLRTILPDVQLLSVHELPRVGECLREVSESLLPGSRPQGGKVVADYIATRNGTRIRLRLDIATWMPNPSTVPGIEQRGNWFLFSSGVWAPEDEFEDAHWLARSVQTSLLTSLEWKRQQGRAVDDVSDPLAAACWEKQARDGTR